MKLFLVMSDTHGDLREAKKVLEQYPQISTVLHLGDFLKDAAILKNMFPQKEFVSVPGNCDGATGEPFEKILEVEGKRLFMTHGNRYDVKSGMARLEEKAAREKADIVLFGHTHIPLYKRTAACLMLNPGSLGYPRGLSDSTYALLEIGNNLIEARIMDV